MGGVIVDGGRIRREWRMGRRTEPWVPIPMVTAVVSGIIQNSKGALNEQIHLKLA